jgi:hypothetical protein
MHCYFEFAVVFLSESVKFVGGYPRDYSLSFNMQVSGVPLLAPSAIRYRLQVWLAPHGSYDSHGIISLNGHAVGTWTADTFTRAGRMTPAHYPQNQPPLQPLNPNLPDLELDLSQSQLLPGPQWNVLNFRYATGNAGVTLYRVRVLAQSTNGQPILTSAPLDIAARNRAHYGSEFTALVADRVRLITGTARELLIRLDVVIAGSRTACAHRDQS